MHTITIFYYKANDSRLYSWHGNAVLLTLYSMCMIITHAPPISKFFLNLKEPNIPKGIH